MVDNSTIRSPNYCTHAHNQCRRASPGTSVSIADASVTDIVDRRATASRKGAMGSSSVGLMDEAEVARQCLSLRGPGQALASQNFPKIETFPTLFSPKFHTLAGRFHRNLPGILLKGCPKHTKFPLTQQIPAPG